MEMFAKRTPPEESEIDRIHKKILYAIWEQIVKRVHNDPVFRELWYSKKIRVDFKFTKKGCCVSFKPCVVWEEDDADR